MSRTHAAADGIVVGVWHNQSVPVLYSYRCRRERWISVIALRRDVGTNLRLLGIIAVVLVFVRSTVEVPHEQEYHTVSQW